MRSLWRSLFSVFLVFCIVFSNSLCALASTTTEQVYDVEPLSLYSAYNLQITPALYDIDATDYNQTPQLVSMTSFNWVDGSSPTNTFKSISGSGYDLNDYYFGYKVSLLDANITSGGASIPTLFKSSCFIDFGYYRHFVRVNNVNYDLSPGAVPAVAYAVISGEYNYNYINDNGGTSSSYDNSFTMRVPVGVYNHSFSPQDETTPSDYIGRHFIKLSVDGYTIDDMVIAENAYRNSGAYIDDFVERYNDNKIVSFSSSTSSLDIYVFYDFSSFVNLNFDSNQVLPNSIDNNYVFYSGYTPFVSNPMVLNVVFDNYIQDNDVSLVANLSQGVYLLLYRLGSGMSDIVTNATDNANRIIQNTTNKINEVKQGVTEVKDSVIETKNSILDLPNKIQDMLKGFFVPDEETINAKFSEFETLLSDRFGLIYQSATIIHDFADSFQSQAVMVADTGGIIQLPSVTVNLAGTDFSFGGYDVDIIPDGFEFLQTAVRLATSMICTVVFINMCKNKLEAILR